MLAVILVQLFWLSFVLIGLAGITLAIRFWPSPSSAKRFSKFLETTHPLLVLTLSFMCGIGACCLYVIPGYLFLWPLQGLLWIYFGLIAAALVTLAVQRATWWQWIIRRPDFKGWAWLGMGLALVSVVSDYIVSIRTGSPLLGDNVVQMAQITHIVQSGSLTLSSPFVGNSGIVDVRYSTNLITALQALATHLFKAPSYQIWLASYAPLRFIIWLALFSLSWVLLPKAVKRWSYIVLAFLPLVFSGYFIFATLPDRIVLAWIALLIVGLWSWLRGYIGSSMAIAATLVIATSHALSALITLLFLVLLAASLLLSKTYRRSYTSGFVIMALLLALPVGLNLYYPNRIDHDPVTRNALSISGTSPVPFHVGPLVIARPQVPWLPEVIVVWLAVLLILHWLPYKKHRAVARGVSIGLIPLLLYFTSFSYAGLIGIYYLNRTNKDRALRCLLLAVTFFYALAVYNPLTYPILHALLPPWGIARINEFNIVGFISPIVALLWIFSLLLKRMRLANWGPLFVTLLPVITVVMGTAFYNNPIALPFGTPKDANKDTFVTTAKSLQQLEPSLYGHTVYSPDEALSAMIPVTMTANILKIYSTDMSPPVDTLARSHCSNRLMNTLASDDLLAAHIDRVITVTGNQYVATDSSRFIRLVQSRPWLRQIDQYKDVIVYQVVYAPNQKPTIHSRCALPYGT